MDGGPRSPEPRRGQHVASGTSRYNFLIASTAVADEVEINRSRVATPRQVQSDWDEFFSRYAKVEIDDAPATWTDLAVFLLGVGNTHALP